MFFYTNIHVHQTVTLRAEWIIFFNKSVYRLSGLGTV
jgi:hypothetical protein